VNEVLAAKIVENLERHLRGAELLDLVDPVAGY
jgi:hypothetical protein